MTVQISWVAVLMLSLGSGVVLTSQPVGAMIYKCVDSSGSSMFTDSPPHTAQCQVVHQQTSLGSVSRVQPPPSPVGSPALEVALAPDAAAPVYRVGRALVVHTRLNGLRDAKLIVDT